MCGWLPVSVGCRLRSSGGIVRIGLLIERGSGSDATQGRCINRKTARAPGIDAPPTLLGLPMR
jgi:hypothetical protein